VNFGTRKAGDSNCVSSHGACLVDAAILDAIDRLAENSELFRHCLHVMDFAHGDRYKAVTKHD
jgi:hypothetical protein